MKLIVLDASEWRSEDDLHDALLDVLEAPDWHGRNLDAWWDSIGSDNINDLRAPFTITILKAHVLDPALKAYVGKFVELVAEARSERGVEVYASLPD